MSKDLFVYAWLNNIYLYSFPYAYIYIRIYIHIYGLILFTAFLSHLVLQFLFLIFFFLSAPPLCLSTRSAFTLGYFDKVVMKKWRPSK